jgi:hypothetical protein
VIRATRALTHSVGTLGNTLIIGFGANKVWHSLGVLRGVRGEAVATFTDVGEGILDGGTVRIMVCSQN